MPTAPVSPSSHSLALGIFHPKMALSNVRGAALTVKWLPGGMGLCDAGWGCLLGPGHPALWVIVSGAQLETCPLHHAQCLSVSEAQGGHQPEEGTCVLITWQGCPHFLWPRGIVGGS